MSNAPGWPEELPPFHLVNQVPGSSTCVGCVAAMLTNTELTDFSEWVRSQEPWDVEIMAAYCLGHAVWVGPEMRLWEPNMKTAGLGPNWNEVWGRLLMNRAAVLYVRSKRTNDISGHAVVWTGRMVADPLEEELQTIDQYEVNSLSLVKGAWDVPVWLREQIISRKPEKDA